MTSIGAGPSSQAHATGKPAGSVGTQLSLIHIPYNHAARPVRRSGGARCLATSRA
ncbi:hypothetical protein [Streptomyces sp. NRRL S-15]|uniref:hypothetical protein n=1 Tax=Streptomyces sp. NRRL S-15 TaxID=1463886 RepID=UPI000AA1BC06|nr:hypothetical protein [Streptomyces sp. NRRL S-15]